jgi:FtsP/CotA-like multicopper oxidase with cupredoxin domain
MDDRFLNGLRREPPPEFARELHERLRRQGPAAAAARAWRPLRWAVPLAGGLAVTLVAVSFTFPAVRASAQAFLDLFRVRNFAAVSIDPARFERLKDQKLDFRSLLADRVETPAEHPAPRVVASPQEAAGLAGFAVRVPAAPPRGFVPDTIAVVSGATVSVRVRTAVLREALEKLDIHDLQVPEGLDGQTVTTRTSPAVTQRFVRERQRIEFVQARSPEVSLPVGVDLERFGEIGLRIAGLEPGEARRFARSIDWHGTLVVPVPLNASSFTEVSVRGGRGLLVSFREDAAAGSRGHHHEGALLLWSEGDMVYALTANLPDLRLVQMAESIR